MAREIIDKVKEEIERLLDAGFIRPCRYAEWIANVVPVRKKNGKIRVCIDFRPLNMASPKDEYPMPVADQLIDAAAGHKIISLMDGNAGYNQIPIAEEDIHKTAFRCPGNLGIFEWPVMPFGLKNAGATYQRAMDAIFHNLIGKTMEVYIDDVIVRSEEKFQHLQHLTQSFECMRKHKLKMNPLKCAFGVTAGQFLGFLVHQRGIEIDHNKAKAIIEAKPPTNKKQLQGFLGKVNYLRRFISNAAGKTRVFSPLLRLAGTGEFEWQDHHQKAFDSLKEYLSHPPVLIPPVKGKSFYLYVAASDGSVGAMLVQKDEDGKERAIYYLSRLLNDAERRYKPIERLCLSLYFACTKLRHYVLSETTYVISQFDIIKYMLCQPVSGGRIAKWSMALMPYALEFLAQKSVKGQAVASFLADHPAEEIKETEILDSTYISFRPWTLWFDGSSTRYNAGAGIVIVSPCGIKIEYAFNLDFPCSNNQAEYEALILGLEILYDTGATEIQIYGDSTLVIRQVCGNFRCENTNLISYLRYTRFLLSKFSEATLSFRPREDNERANDLAQMGSGFRPTNPKVKLIINTKPSFKAERIEFNELDFRSDWRQPIRDYLQKPTANVSPAFKYKCRNYVIMGDILYFKDPSGILMRCVGSQEAMLAMAEVHEGLGGAHQAGPKMRWLLHRYGLYWPAMGMDCARYAKGCEACQKHAPLQHAPATELHSIVKPWPFRGWAMDIIGQIHPPSSKGHSYILVATDYFTKWVEAQPYKSINQQDVIEFIRERILYRFGLPETITADRGTVFIGEEVQQFAKDGGFRMIHSTPYYAQANGQAESTNKTLIAIIKKAIVENPRGWHNVLSSALWAYRTTKKTATGTTPFNLVYGHDAMLPLELTIASIRRAMQFGYNPDDYQSAMLAELQDLSEARVMAFERMEAQKRQIERSYNKRMKAREFQVGDLVWKAKLPIGQKSRRLGKWSPVWDGPYRVLRCLKGNAYVLSPKPGKEDEQLMNGQYLKKYKPNMWQQVPGDIYDDMIKQKEERNNLQMVKHIT